MQQLKKLLKTSAIWEIGICFLALYTPFIYSILQSFIQSIPLFFSTASSSLTQSSYSSPSSFLQAMRSQVLCFILILQILNMACVINSRPFLPSGPETSPTKMNFNKEIGEEFKEVSSKIGSSPPSCEHKCYGCMPCQAIQVPTITSRVGVQYANYEPEGWKCKCGPTLYSP